jgi:hypothetical protein
VKSEFHLDTTERVIAHYHMADRSDDYRASASECLRLARMTTDENARTSLLVMAQKWFELANGPPSQDTLDVAVQAFNEWQMSPQSVAQQQQQIQPRKKG